MTPEQVGMYIYMLILEWTDKAPIDDDMKRLAVRCGWDVRIVRRLTNELVDLAKYQREEGKLSNERMQIEIGIYVAKVNAKRTKAADTSRADVAQMSENSPIASQQLADSCATAGEHLSEKDNKNNDTTQKTARYTRARNTQIQKPDSERSSITSVVNSAAPPLKIDLDDLSDRLLAACNGALDNPVNCMGLLSLSIPQMWIDRGCDLERDIIPTLQAAGKKYHGKNINTWNYFTKMIAEAKANREAGLPAVAAAGASKRGGREAEERDVRLRAQRERIRRENGWTEEVTHG